MLDLAGHSEGGLVLLRDVSQRTEISEGYLVQLLMPLRAAGLVRTARGAHGGFALGRHPSEITISDIITVVEGSTAPAECVDDATICSRSRLCRTRDVWAKLKEATDGVLGSITLQDLLECKEIELKEVRDNAAVD